MIPGRDKRAPGLDWTTSTPTIRSNVMITSAGTYYPDTLPNDAVAVLERCRAAGTRVVLTYEYTEGPYRYTGRISRSMGNPSYPGGGLKAALLVYNARCMGGSCVSGGPLVRIETSAGKTVLWAAPSLNA